MKQKRIHVISYPLTLIKSLTAYNTKHLYKCSKAERGCLTVREFGISYGTLFDYLFTYHREEGVLIRGAYDVPKDAYIYYVEAPTFAAPLNRIYSYEKKTLKEAGYSDKQIHTAYTGNY